MIELAKKQGQPHLGRACDDNIRYLQEFINIHGVMVEKPLFIRKLMWRFGVKIVATLLVIN
ncbi:hypothetical protein ACOZZS_000098 [Cronobacter dublinensis]